VKSEEFGVHTFATLLYVRLFYKNGTKMKTFYFYFLEVLFQFSLCSLAGFKLSFLFVFWRFILQVITGQKIYRKNPFVFFSQNSYNLPLRHLVLCDCHLLNFKVFRNNNLRKLVHVSA